MVTDSDKQYLVEQIRIYYAIKESSLQSIFSMNQQIFGTNFYGWMQGENFNIRISSLVQELILRNKLDDFIRIVRDDYPEFAEKYVTSETKNKLEKFKEILRGHFSSLENSINAAYQASLPKRYIDKDNAENIDDLMQKLRHNNLSHKKYSFLEIFGVNLRLYLDSKVACTVDVDLENWGQKYIENYLELFEELKQEKIQLEKEAKKWKPGILLAVSQNGQNYIMEVWLIKNLNKYDRKNCLSDDCQRLYFEASEEELLGGRAKISVKKINTLTDINKSLIIARLINDFYEKLSIYYNRSSKDEIKPPQIHIFLPSENMNYPIDCCSCEDEADEDYAQTIGQEYEVIIRCSERLSLQSNPSILNWQDYGKNLKSKLDSAAVDIFNLYESDRKKTLFKEFRQKMKDSQQKEKIGMAIINTFENKEPGTLLRTAGVPLALWIRKKFSKIDNRLELRKLLENTPLKELPNKVNHTRMDAFDADDPENHVGSHICLLWDDPNLLPPQQFLGLDEL